MILKELFHLFKPIIFPHHVDNQQSLITTGFLIMNLHKKVN